MKKLLAILLSVLMLCTLIPFATVSASDEPTIVVEVDEEANAGDEIEVTVNLANNPGVIAATVEILFDANAFELVTYFDEDEEMWLPQIEVGTTFKASSNKYITFAQIDENGFSKKCVVSYIRGTATSDCTKEWFFTATFKVKDTAVSGNYDLAVSYDPENFVNLADETVYFGKQDASIYINGTEPTPPACEHEYAYDCSKNCSKCGEETRPEAEHQYFNDCETVCTICYEETREASHNVKHVEAKAATCIEMGNIEYWYCDVCGAAWLDAECTRNTNLRAVVLPFGDHTYSSEVDPSCEVCGEERDLGLQNIIAFSGNSVSEDISGLAFKFDVDANISIGAGYIADYNTATVTINGVECKLVKMGAIANNQGKFDQTLDDLIDGKVLDVNAEKVFEMDGKTCFAIRIRNIPEQYLDADIIVRPYYIYADANGVEYPVYGADQIQSYDGVLNG